MSRIKIPVSFGFNSNPTGTTPTYVSSSSGSYVGEAANLLEPVSSVTVTVSSRTTGLPAAVYQAETGTATYTSLSTDTSGNVPGWVDPGSYAVTAAAAGGFAGATVNFEAVRGDGVTNVAPGAVDIAQLTAAVAATLVPTGAILDFAGPTAPTGYVFGDGSVYSIGAAGSTYYNLSRICGTNWNQGNEGTGNFRVPDLRSVVLVGAGQNARLLGTTSRSLSAFGGEETHVLSPSEHYLQPQQLLFNAYNEYASQPNFNAVSGWTYGNSLSGSAGGANPHNNLQPFAVVNRIIKL